MFQAYLLGMVWSCYKYLQFNILRHSQVREYTVDPDTEVSTASRAYKLFQHN